MFDVECPYCKADIIIEIVGEEDEPLQQDCHECEKNFVYVTHVSISFEAFPAECLNGGEHVYENTVTYPPEYSRIVCKTCGENA